MRDFWHGMVGFLSYALSELSFFGLWLGLGGLLGLLLGLPVAWASARWAYPRQSLDRLDQGSPPVPRWLFFSMPLLRWCWWLTWWSAIPTCLIAVGLVWGCAQGCYRAVLHQRLTPQVSQRAALQLVVLVWQSSAPSELAKVDPEKGIPTQVLFPTLLSACQKPLAVKLVPPLKNQPKAAWMADFAVRRMIGWYLHCDVESRLVYVQAIREEICSRPAPGCHQASLREVAEVGCQKYVEPQLANWCYDWVLGFMTRFFQILLLLLLVPRLSYELSVALLHWWARRKSIPKSV
ncbi:hypothetical protein IV102_04560 [bacterium]|nr:hypothetical protein [bacterium]